MTLRRCRGDSFFKTTLCEPSEPSIQAKLDNFTVGQPRYRAVFLHETTTFRVWERARAPPYGVKNVQKGPLRGENRSVACPVRNDVVGAAGAAEKKGW